MRITFLLPSDNLTGGNRVVAIYAQQLMVRGHEVLVVTCAPERLSPREMLRAVRKGGLAKPAKPPVTANRPHRLVRRAAQDFGAPACHHRC